MRLYEIIEGLRLIESAIDEAGGELTPETEAELSALEVDLTVKADNIAALIAESERAAEAYDHESVRLDSLARAQRGKAARLRLWLKDAMQAAGRDKVKGARFTLAVQQNSAPSIQWFDPGEPIPAEFVRVRTEPDGDKIRDAYKRGMLPPGFSVNRGTHLRIK